MEYKDDICCEFTGKDFLMSIFYQNHSEHFHFFTSDNNTYASHLHRQIELLFVLEGSLCVTVDHTDYTLSAHEGILIYPNQLHSLTTLQCSKTLLCIFDSDFCHAYQQHFHNQLPVCPSFSLDELGAHGSIAIDGLLVLTADFKKGSPIPPETLALSEGYLTLLLASLFRHMTLKPRITSTDLALEQKLLLYIDSNYTENLSLEILAKQFGISRFSLSRLFTDKLHTTFPNYVNCKRLEHAKDQLRSTNFSVTQIALDAGFGSPRTFFREFKEYYGITPGDYRKSCLPPNA